MMPAAADGAAARLLRLRHAHSRSENHDYGNDVGTKSPRTTSNEGVVPTIWPVEEVTAVA